MRRESNSKDYVTDGLILHLDAIKNAINGTHSNSTTTWYDLSTSANNVSMINPVWSDDYLTFNGTTTRGQTGANVNLSGLSKCTVEVLFKNIGSSINIVLEHSPNQNNNPGGWLVAINNYAGLNIDFTVKKNGSGEYLGAGLARTITEDLLAFQYDDTTNVNTTELEMFANSTKQTGTYPAGIQFTTTTPLLTSILYIGARSGNVLPFSGAIRAIRIYNRKLSTAELYQNKITDFRRYGIIK